VLRVVALLVSHVLRVVALLVSHVLRVVALLVSHVLRGVAIRIMQHMNSKIISDITKRHVYHAYLHMLW